MTPRAHRALMARHGATSRPDVGHVADKVLSTAVAAVATGVLVLSDLQAGPGHLLLASGAALAAGALFGAVGVAGVMLGGLAAASQVGAPVAALLGLGNGLHAAAGWAAFHLLPRFGQRVGRGLPDLRSYLAAVGGGLVAALLAAPLFTLAVPSKPSFLVSAGLDFVGALGGVVLVGLPALLTAPALGRRLEPVPGELPTRPARVLEDSADEPSDPPTDLEATVLVRRSASQAARGMRLGGVAILVVTLVAVPVSTVAPAGAYWVTLLYLLAVIWGARTYGLRGGVLAASAAGLAFVAASRLVAAVTGGGVHALPLYAQLLLLSPVGAYLGSAREREVGLRRDLVSHARLLRRDLLRVVRALTSAIEAKDAYTEAHLRRVADYAVAVAARLGIEGHQLETIYYAAMLHDVGKIGVPEAVLRKPGPLTPEEEEVMRRHPEIGARMVAGLDLLSDAAPAIRHHQERWDGGNGSGAGGYPGYPDGLRGEQIPLGARIIAVVDAYDAMTSHRPYRSALSHRDAVAELRAEAGRQFDPRVVGAFLDELRENPWTG